MTADGSATIATAAYMPLAPNATRDPALSALSRSGLIEAKDDNGKKQYRLTPAGEEALDARRGQLSAIEARCGVYREWPPHAQDRAADSAYAESALA
jgi:DNA-binding PadR family transcriptional regulator